MLIYPGPVDRIRQGVVVVADGAGQAGREEDEGVDVARVERQIQDLGVVDQVAEGGVGGFDGRDIALDFHCFRGLADVQRNVEGGLLLQVENDASMLVLLESGGLNGDGVGAGRKIQDQIAPVRPGGGLASAIGRGIDGRNGK